MANLGSCYIKSCCVTTLRSVNSSIYISVCVCVSRACMRANVIACLGNTPARLGPAVSLDLISHSDELLCGTGAYGLKKKEFFLPLCHCFTEGPYTLSAPRKAVPPSSYPQHFAPVCLSRLIRDGFGSVHHLTYEYRHPGRQTEWDEPSSLS